MELIHHPVAFVPYLKTVIWGGSGIAAYKGLSATRSRVGESWEVSAIPGHESVVADGPYRGMTLGQLVERFGASLVGARNFERFGSTFPLLVKLIDAADNLSIQVHPDDELARDRHDAMGKTELWNIIRATPGAKVYSGLSRPLTPAEYERRVADHSIMEVIATHDSAPGDVFFLPPGRIHAIGAGNLLVEIQQSSDITYRIYDYGRLGIDGRPRALQTGQARDAIDYNVYNDYKLEPRDTLLVDCRYFVVHRLQSGDNSTVLPHTRDSFTIVMCLDGDADICYPSADPAGAACTATRHIRQGETLLFPANMERLTVTGRATILSTQA